MEPNQYDMKLLTETADLKMRNILTTDNGMFGDSFVTKFDYTTLMPSISEIKESFLDVEVSSQPNALLQYLRATIRNAAECRMQYRSAPSSQEGLMAEAIPAINCEIAQHLSKYPKQAPRGQSYTPGAVAARANRQKKKMYVEQLKEEIVKLSNENKKHLNIMLTLRDEIGSLQAEEQALRTILHQANVSKALINSKVYTTEFAVRGQSS